jgi:hypothetical protein
VSEIDQHRKLIAEYIRKIAELTKSGVIEYGPWEVLELLAEDVERGNYASRNPTR